MGWAHVNTCRNCGYHYTSTFESVDEGNCKSHSVTTYDFCTNTDGEPLVVTIVGQSYVNHKNVQYQDLPNESREYTAENGNTVCVSVNQTVCLSCSAVTQKTVIEQEYNGDNIHVRETHTIYSYRDETPVISQINETTYGIIVNGRSFATRMVDQMYNNGQPTWQNTYEYDYPEAKTGHYCHYIYYRIDNQTGERIKQYERTYHDYWWVYELAEGSESCTDGVNHIRKCQMCGDIAESEINNVGHIFVGGTVTDLTAYGSRCGQTVCESTCLCGKERHLSRYDNGCDFKYVYDEEMGGNVYTCRSCGYFYTVITQWIDDGNCTKHFVDTYHLGTNTDSEPLTVVIVGNSVVNHDARPVDLSNEDGEYTAENGNTVGVSACQYVCTVCSAITKKTVREQEFNANHILVKETDTNYSYVNGAFVLAGTVERTYGIIVGTDSFKTRQVNKEYENEQLTHTVAFEYDYPDAATGDYCHYIEYYIDSMTGKRIKNTESTNHSIVHDSANTYNLTAYGSECGQIIVEDRCPCGEWHYFVICQDGCLFDYASETVDGVIVETYTCTVCKYYYVRRTEWIDDGNNYHHSVTTYDFSPNKDDDKLTFTIVGQSQPIQ